MITVTKTFLPPQDEYNSILKRAWDNNWITNRGELVLELEAKLKSYLGVENVIAMTNGTLPIQIAIKALGLKGEIITTPFSYVATTSSIVWEGCTPVFVDIDPDYLTIDEAKIEAAITKNTTGILATHVYGNPCNVEVIEEIAEKYDLKVIYDAAHCFGVKYKGQSIFKYGDISTCSFHATKVFHTGEGGAAFCNKKYDSVYYGHNFGHDGPGKFMGAGINAKMSELQGAMGLAVLPYMDFILKERKSIFQIYKKGLQNLSIQFLKLRESTEWNYSYCPIILDNEKKLFELTSSLERSQIYTRRYFYPSLNTLSYLNQNKMSVSEGISKRILCLPLYAQMQKEDAEKIIQIIKSVI